VGDIVLQRQRSGGGGDGVLGLDIVLDEDRHAIERPQRVPGAAARIGRLRLCQRIWVERDDAAQLRPLRSIAAMRAR
jgi:hypothetical protein